MDFGSSRSAHEKTERIGSYVRGPTSFRLHLVVSLRVRAAPEENDASETAGRIQLSFLRVRCKLNELCSLQLRVRNQLFFLRQQLQYHDRLANYSCRFGGGLLPKKEVL